MVFVWKSGKNSMPCGKCHRVMEWPAVVQASSAYFFGYVYFIGEWFFFGLGLMGHKKIT
jgi:hypothetical protein